MANLSARNLDDLKLSKNISFLMEIGRLGISRNAQKTTEAINDVLFEIQQNPELRKQVIKLLKK